MKNNPGSVGADGNAQARRMTREEWMSSFRKWSSYEIGKDGCEYVRAPEFMMCWTEIGALADYRVKQQERRDASFNALNARRNAKGKRPISRAKFNERRDRFDEFRRLDSDLTFREFIEYKKTGEL